MCLCDRRLGRYKPWPRALKIKSGPLYLEVLALALTLAPRTSPSPWPPLRAAPSLPASSPFHQASIFVSVVSYRDSEANPTVVDLFACAANPGRVSVGLVWQLEAGVADDEAMRRATPGGKEIRGGRVRSLFMPAADAAGPSWARRVAQSLWKGEKYVLQIDSHTRFRPG